MRIFCLFYFSLVCFSVNNILEAHPGGHQFIFDLKKSHVAWKGHEIEGKKESSHFGRFFLQSASLKMLVSGEGKKKKTVSKGEFFVDMNSVVCDDIKSKILNKKLISHLKSKDFLSVEKFPIAKFQIQKIEFEKTAAKSCENKSSDKKSMKKDFNSEKNGVMTGEIQFLGKKKNISIPFTMKNLPKGKDMKKSEPPAHNMVFEGSFELNRRDFGMNFRSADLKKSEISKEYIKDQIDLSFKLFASGVSAH